jgi:GGDEF domain-containing protein
MSLALSNIALREKLRTQALRDPLTGLYNRRYMEDVLIATPISPSATAARSPSSCSTSTISSA